MYTERGWCGDFFLAGLIMAFFVTCATLAFSYPEYRRAEPQRGFWGVIYDILAGADLNELG